jgi:hypothetical protein
MPSTLGGAPKKFAEDRSVGVVDDVDPAAVHRADDPVDVGDGDVGKSERGDVPGDLGVERRGGNVRPLLPRERDACVRLRLGENPEPSEVRVDLRRTGRVTDGQARRGIDEQRPAGVRDDRRGGEDDSEQK